MPSNVNPMERFINKKHFSYYWRVLKSQKKIIIIVLDLLASNFVIFKDDQL